MKTAHDTYGEALTSPIALVCLEQENRGHGLPRQAAIIVLLCTWLMFWCVPSQASTSKQGKNELVHWFVDAHAPLR